MKTYSVYEHVFPNGKRYIGITCEPKKRWNGGHGYDTQPKMKRAIQCYGWDNIEHNIICEGMPKEQAERLEMYLIDKLDTINNGYNVSIGGENINSYYLNEHVLYMIRENEADNKKYGFNEPDDGVVAYFKEGKTDGERAKFVNLIDEVIERDFSDYKDWRTDGLIDGRNERVEAYFYYAIHIIYQLSDGFYDKNRIKPYQWARAEYMSKGVNICSKEYMDGFYMPDMSLAVPLYC